MQHKTLVDFHVFEQKQQELLISVQGNEVLHYEENAKDNGDEAPFVIPDLVEIFAQAANLGMLSGAFFQPWHSTAKILSKDKDLANKTHTWRISLNSIDKGGLLVLVNLFRGGDLEKITIGSLNRAAAISSSLPELDLQSLQYPGYYQPIPFRFDHELPERRYKDRMIQIIFATELEKPLTQKVYSALEKWTNLLLHGPFPDKETGPGKAGAIPSLAYQLDAFTIEQRFEIFIGEEAAFHAIINYAHCLHHSGHPIEEIRIR
jgi:hypothetical protein